MKNIIDLKRKQLDKIRELIKEGYVLTNLPDDSGKLFYHHEKTGKTVKIKAKYSKYKFFSEKEKEVVDSFYAYHQHEDDFIHDEVGKLVALTGAAYYGREDMLIHLRATFNPNNPANK